MDYKNITIEFIKDRFDSAKNELDDLLTYFKNVTKQKENSICLFGAGAVGREMYCYLLRNQINVDFFCDNNLEKWGVTIVDDVKCLSIYELEAIKNNVVVIISVGTDNQISEQLQGIGIKKIFKWPLETFHVLSNDVFLLRKEELINKISNLFDILEDEHSKKIVYYKIFTMFATRGQIKQFSYKEIETLPQYFPKDIISLGKEEIFVDCGAYIGDTLGCFLRQDGYGNLKEYVCYELDRDNFERLKSYVVHLEKQIQSKILLYNVGVSDKYRKIRYFPNGVATSVQDIGDIEGVVVSIDEQIGHKKITFIKMDVEGSEMLALIGAKDSIRKNKPKCSISSYHSGADLWEIPFYLKELVPEYKIYIRHHTCTYADTVCYAII